VLAVAAFMAFGRGGSQRPGSGRFETASVDRGRIVARVTATGTLSALVTVQVGSQVSGRIQELFVDFNSPVKAGQLLARIDPQLFQASVEQARANLAAAEGNLARARAQSTDATRQRDRARALFEGDHLIAEADVETADANAQAAAAQVQAMQGAVAQSQASLHQAQVNLDYTRIISPIDGIVISRSVDIGQTVASALQAPTLFSLAQDLRKIQVDTDVSEADVGRLRSGMEASFTVDAFPGDRFKGIVRQIRNAAQTVQNVVTYNAVLDAANDDLRLRPGMTATVTFISAEKSDVLRVPNSALRFRPPPDLATRQMTKNSPDQRTVWILRGNRPTPLTIRVGLSDGSVTELVEGDLHEADKLVTEAIGAGGGPSGTPPPAFRRTF